MSAMSARDRSSAFRAASISSGAPAASSTHHRSGEVSGSTRSPRNKLVIARLDRGIQYSAAFIVLHHGLCILDHPLSRVMTTGYDATTAPSPHPEERPMGPRLEGWLRGHSWFETPRVGAAPHHEGLGLNSSSSLPVDRHGSCCRRTIPG